jgi:uncharacterized membrane protein
MIALALGAAVLLRAKGTPSHRRIGRLYFYTMLVATLSAFGICHFDIVFAPVRTGPGLFGLFHWEAVFTLAFLLLAFFAATRQQRALWAYLRTRSAIAILWQWVC